MSMGGQRHTLAALTLAKRPATHFTGGWLGLGAGLVWYGKSHPTGVRALDCLARGEWLYWLHCTGRPHDSYDVLVTGYSHPTRSCVLNLKHSRRGACKSQNKDSNLAICCDSKSFSCEFHEGIWGSRGIAPLFLKLGTRWRWVVNFNVPSSFTPGKQPQCPLNMRLVGLHSRSCHGGEENLLPYWDLNPRPSSP